MTSKKLSILATGSRGDVQPYVALGQGLQKAGYEVTIVTHAMFETFVREAGLEFALIQHDPQQDLQGEKGQIALDGSNPTKSMQTFIEMIVEALPGVFKDCFEACRNADAVICSPLAFYCGPHIAERLNIPYLNAFYLPIHPTRAFPNYMFATRRNRGGIFNRLSYLPTELTEWIPFMGVTNKCRREILDLKPIGPGYFSRIYTARMVYGFSPTVFPKPPDWGQHISVAGYWFYDQPWTPPQKLIDFLDAGEPPVYVGFGSMNTGNPQTMTEIVLDALSRTKQRGILATGWGGLTQSNVSGDIFVVDAVPHHWLFPKMKAVVHHGGAGTTAAGLRAGMPTIVIPFYVDQPFWGYRVAQLGCGPDPIPRKSLTAERLADAISEVVKSPTIQGKAAATGERIRSEDGVGAAVNAIKAYLS